jgi:hypothetical protein
MGRNRSRRRKRGAGAAAPRRAQPGETRGRANGARAARAHPPQPAPSRRGGRPAIEDRPKPPWHPFPLVELCVLIGIVLLVLGALDLDSDRGKLLLVSGMVLGSLGGLDTALREHLAGYRSHTTVISALPAVVTAAALYFAGAPWPLVVAGAALVFVAAFWALRRTYMRRARG